MTRCLAITGLLLLATPAYADETAPDRGAFGLGAFFLNGAGGAATFTPGITATYWVTDQLIINAILGLDAPDGQDAHFLIVGGADYYVLKVQHFGGFIGGEFGVNVNPIAFGGLGQGNDTQILFRLEGGGEYFASEHFGIFVSPGLSFNTNKTFFGLTTMLGARVYY